MADVKQSYAAF